MYLNAIQYFHPQQGEIYLASGSKGHELYMDKDKKDRKELNALINQLVKKEIV